MKNKTPLTVLFCMALWICNAQHDNNWYFGDHGGLDFSSGSPVPLSGSQMYTYEGSAVMSDANGQLLFYTNGESVWNRNHQLMASNIGGHTSATQSAVVVPHPSLAEHYYIFTLMNAAGQGGLRYTEVDMAGNGGLGSIIVSNQQLASTLCEKLTATLHANGTDIWIIAHDFGNNDFLSFLVTGTGINSVPVISSAGEIINNPAIGDHTGYMALSPNAAKIATGSSYVGVELFDFDNTTGVVSNAVKLSDYWGYNYGVEFSPKGNMLYATKGQGLYQYNLEAQDIPGSETLISAITIPGAIKVGPDSKLYVVNNMAVTKISVINNPNEQGTACNFQLGAINIAGTTQWGLPVFFESPFYVLDITAQNACAGNEVSLLANCTLQPDTIDWDFGDGTTSNEVNPVHVYDAPGTYTIKIKAKRGFFVRYFTKVITIFEAPTATQPQDLEIIAEGNACQQVFLLNEQDSQILDGQSADGFSVNYYATAADAESNDNTLPVDYTNVETEQIIYARVSSNVSGCYAITSFTINVVCDAELPATAEIPKGISPNNDNRNDNFDLSGYDVENISVFNRYGRKVYSKAGYKNEWYGQTNSGGELPTGAYYYYLQITGGKQKTGWIYINR